LRKSPAFTAAAVLTLVVGIGANATMIDVIDRVFVRNPVGVVNPTQVVRLWLADTRTSRTEPSVSYAKYAAVRDGLDGAVQVATYLPWSLSYGIGSAEVVKVRAAHVSDSYFEVLGTHPALGRLLGPAERDRDGEPRVVLSHSFWMRRYGGDPSILGTTVRIGQAVFAIIGVAEPGFIGPDLEAVDVWLPLGATGAWSRKDWRTFVENSNNRIIARVPSTMPAAAVAERSSAALRARPETWQGADDGFVDITAVPLIVRGSASIPAPWLMAAVSGFIFLVACANTATLFYVRGMRRSPEIAVRLALGAGRSRVLRQLLVESMLIACVAGAGAALVMTVGRPALSATLLPDVGVLEASIDIRAVLLVFACAALAGVICGGAPGIRLFTSPPALWRGTQAHAGGSVSGTRLLAVVAGQTALVLPALAGAGLFLASLHTATSMDLGFNPTGVVVVEANMDSDGRSPEEVQDLAYRMVDRLQQLPEVTTAGASVYSPVMTLLMTNVWESGREVLKSANVQPVTGDYLTVMGVRMVEGRSLRADDDRPGAPAVAVVSESFARQVWPGQSPIGRCFMATGARCLTVVGVTRDIHTMGFKPSASPIFFVPARATKNFLYSPFIALKLKARLAVLAPMVRHAIASVDPNMPFVEVLPIERHFEPLIRKWRVGAIVFSLFGAIGLLVAAVGLYGIVAYVTALQQRESAIRLALGASPARLLSTSLVRAGVAVTLGVCAGTALALAGGKAVASQLYGITPQDPRVHATVIATLLMTAAIAAYLPARRVKSTDPTVLLRAE
jgi:putative ABC transport system permease protein